MKKLILPIILLSWLFANGQPVATIVQMGQRLPHLYYWDTNWVDHKVLTHLNGAFCYDDGVPTGNTGFLDFNYRDCFLGRTCITNLPLRVIGIAGVAHIGTLGAPIPYLSEERLPEYFRLYQMLDDSLHFVREIQWDTATPQYQMVLPYNSSNYYGGYDTVYNLYEAYFEKPVMIHDTFVVGGTTYNNKQHGFDPEVFENPYMWAFVREHKPTWYRPLWLQSSTVLPHPPNPPFYYIKCLSTYHTTMPPYNYYEDTNVFHKILPYTPASLIDEVWLPFFVIFDTSFVYEACIGVATTGLYVEAVDTLGNVTLAWDDSGVEQWQVSVAPLGMEADSGMLFETPINYLQVTGLDTGTWYVAQVRTLCDTDLFGGWSDSVLLYVPGASCVTPTGLHVVAVDSAMVSLAWDAGTASTWQVERGMCDLGMSNAQKVTTQAPALTVADLPFGNAWYWARVRVVCDSDFWSDWTDTVRFYVPNQHTGGNPDDTTQAISLVEQYTYLMPNPARDEVTVASSFRVKAVELYAADGKLLQQVEVNAVGTTLSLEGSPAGIYFVRVRTSAGVTTKRLVVE